MIFFEKNMNFEQILLIFLKKKAEKCNFFQKNSNFIKIFMIFIKKKHEFGTNSIDFLKKKLKSVIYFEKIRISSKYS